MIIFNPYEVTSENCTLKIGKDYVLAEDYYYCNTEDLDEDILDDYLKIMELGQYGNIYIPSGTMMEFKGLDYNGWPTFIIKGEEIDFAGDLDMMLLEVR